MAVTIAQAKTGTAASAVASLVITLDSSTVTGHAIVVVVRAQADGGDDTPQHTVGGNSGDTSYTEAKTQTFVPGVKRLSLFYFPNITGRSGHAVTVTFGALCFASVRVLELTSVVTSSIVTGTPASASAANAAGLSSGSVTPSAAGLHIAAFTYKGAFAGAGQTITPTWSGGTQEVEIDENDTAGTGPLSIVTKAAANGVAENPSWSMNDFAEGLAALDVAFAEDGGGGGAVVPGNLLLMGVG